MVEIIFELICLLITAYMTLEVIVFLILQTVTYLTDLFNKVS